MSRLRVAILGSGNIGTDLLYKLTRSQRLEPVLMAGVDPNSPGLAIAHGLGITTTADGIEGLLPHRDQIDLVFEATSAWIHRTHAPLLAEAGLPVVDLTPARIGPLVVPPVNLHDHLGAPNVNLITCGGQATVPIVSAVSAVARVPYAEIVSTVASKSAGPGTRQNIDEFTQTTSASLVEVGGADHGKAIMVLNPADPPILMRNTVFCAIGDDADRMAITDSLASMVREVASYVPGYRVKNGPVFEEGVFDTPGGTVDTRVVVLLEVEGAGDHFPPYAGNLDIMTASAVRVGEAMSATAGARK